MSPCMASHMIITGRTSGQDYKAGFLWMFCPCSCHFVRLASRLLFVLYPKEHCWIFCAFRIICYLCPQILIENINISYEENIIFH